VRFLGWLDGERKLKELAEATIFCLPSHVEGLPNAMIEAMAAGLPVVVTPVGSIPDAISSKENGLIAPVGDSKALANVLRELLLRPDLRERVGRNAHKTARHDYSAGQAVVQLASLAGNVKR
jgi:glycosyltransferase involved in cell wall biosynthesis